MCTRPIDIQKVDKATNQCRVYQVPCGKCDECLKMAQADFAALSVLEAQNSKSVHFVTLTYSNEHVPIMVSDKDSRMRYIDHSKSRPFFVNLCVSKTKSLMASEYNGLDLCPSLCREDLRLFLKRTRVRWKRLMKLESLPPFRYSGFGEYGGQTFRPHFHLLFYDADPQFVSFLANEWNEQFGFADVKFVPKVNKDGSPGYVKVSKYISKYISKPKQQNDWILHDLCEPPSPFVFSAFRYKRYRL